jgi:hypothetical protein
MTEKEINRIEYSTRKIKRFYALFIVEPTAKIAPGLRFCGARHCAGLNRRTPPQRCVIRQCRLRCATIHLILTFDNQTLPQRRSWNPEGSAAAKGR